ncbi:serine hydrolase domain-containing protein [Fodinicola acaciae]|uniref:serine hydrolase domain-containing protein n=1 Tax=Fodinicola acaciae TaxID=2681555 RepID=UPI0013D33B50|nr:serine hydrolase [Fodinicola acaciae]
MADFATSGKEKSLDAFLAALDASGQEMHTLMLLRHGEVALAAEWSPYRLDDRQLLFSISKSFTSIAVGLAIDAGLLSLDDPVLAFFEPPEKVGDNLAAMRIWHLLTMTTGHDEDTIGRIHGDNAVRAFLALDVEHEPGSHFVYNTGATYVLSAILQKVTGESLLSYLWPRLLQPLQATEATWEVLDGIVAGGFGLSVRTETVARFGQLLLRRGQWRDQQLVPAEWIDAATAKQVPTLNREPGDWQQGYGFQFWRCRHGAYRGDGAFGQFCVVFPDHDAVLAITGGGENMQQTLDIVWQYLLPALQGDEVLSLQRLEIRPPAGPPPRPGDGRTYDFVENDAFLRSIRLDPDGSGTFTFAANGATNEVVFRAGGWREAVDPLDWRPIEGDSSDPANRLVTSAYGDGDSFVATMRPLSTPFVYTFVCRAAGDRMVVDVRVNVSFGPTEFTLTSS